MYTVIWKTLLLDRLAVIYVAADPAERERMAAGVEAFNAGSRPTRWTWASPVWVGIGSPSRRS